ncbi:L,D-transpeptidase catalytic domain [Rhodoblastus acidophilus]|uniref:L,D-transpeptidase catalytic domain n=1 Tax=Rhodoblastus acidophilus TaxID=1074 RepID=A0A212QK98_RHOAC|nr:L,D-transpeptidase [Rhodoblastus acidophilus]MCW2317543.1 lipoprotein-anchoring transpeptidase ErfK/SrfK [Rhodoblastus acidophilus]PPQ39913.1 L,D-transpeptidase [Rhodoblastus acidophilus]RAI18481.1 L,D-transpeptidase [Rhodoblastus acidophilus]SNB59820.1 L,D-transpeptidase catalytic domain [Rhodoblastus acidophilus]
MNFRILAVYGLMAAALAGCNGVGGVRTPDPTLNSRDKEFLSLAPNTNVGGEYERFIVDDPTGAAPGTITIDSSKNFLYFSMPNKKAIRYGVATGSEAAGWRGEARVGKLAEWPGWMPPADMLERWPHLRPTAEAGGLPGGPDNPLGARAMYLFQGNKDTLYRIHGTNEPDKIGQHVSSGCIRMRNVDAIDLYNRVKIGTKVVVL